MLCALLYVYTNVAHHCYICEVHLQGEDMMQLQVRLEREETRNSELCSKATKQEQVWLLCSANESAAQRGDSDVVLSVQ